MQSDHHAQINIETLILGNPRYETHQEGNNTVETVSLTLAVTFENNFKERRLPIISLSLGALKSSSQNIQDIQSIHNIRGTLLEPLSSSRTISAERFLHMHFDLKGLECGKEYRYHLAAFDTSFNIKAGGGEGQGNLRPHTATRFKAPPSRHSSLQRNYHFVVSADQEAVNFWYQSTPRHKIQKYEEKIKHREEKIKNDPDRHIKKRTKHLKKLKGKKYKKEQEIEAIKHRGFDPNKIMNDLFDLNMDQRAVTTKIYRDIARLGPDLFLHLGDLMHGDAIMPRKSITTLQGFQDHLAEDFHPTVRDRLGAIISFRAADDHDLGANGADAEMYTKAPQAFKSAVQALNEFWPVPEVNLTSDESEELDKIAETKGLFYKATYGDIDLWVLHNRLYHQSTRSDNLLGETQMRWLQESLSSSTAAVKFILTPLPFVMGKSPKEDYRRGPKYWDDFLQLFAKQGVSAIFSADSHNYSRTDLVIPVKQGSKLTEVTIPHFIVGILGGVPQAVTRTERKLLNKSASTPLLPSDFQSDESYKKSEVQAYYTALNKPSTHPPLGFGNEKNRAFKKGEGWIGENIQREHFGFLDVKIDKSQNKMHTQLYLYPHRKLDKKESATKKHPVFKALSNTEKRKAVFKDEYTYPLNHRLKISQ